MKRLGSKRPLGGTKKVVVASGYFNPLHYGHVSYLEKAKEAGGTLIVIVNNDRQASLKLGGRAGYANHGMKARDRVKTVRALACVDAAVEAVDEDESVCETLRLLHPDIFANGGSTKASQREDAVCRELGIQILDGLGVEVLSLRPHTQHYDWGKPRKESLVAALTGEKQAFSADGPVNPKEATKPFAEMWMGDHPSGPSCVKSSDGDSTLREMLRRTPTMLGSKLAMDASLPFLLKVLSINKALSIQAHPDRALAERLHKERPNVYKDANHKPEIAIALTDFEALCGFRRVGEIATFLDAVPELAELAGAGAAQSLRSAIGNDQEESEALKQAYSHLMHAADDIVDQKVRQLVKRTSPKQESLAEDPLSRCIELVHRLFDQFGGDVGIFSVFFFNYASMKVGECLYMAQNIPHAYLSGDIIECMATSDNVVRGGLTPKFKDVGVLCDMLRYEGKGPHLIKPVEQGPGMRLYADKEIEEFQVTHVHLLAGAQRHLCFSNLGPTVFFTCKGRGSVTVSGEMMKLEPGEVLFLAAGVDVELLAAVDMDVFAACCPPQYFNNK